jgi:hypothetical protein
MLIYLVLTSSGQVERRRVVQRAASLKSAEEPLKGVSRKP